MADSASMWLCSVCGYVHHGSSAPVCCPVCGAPSNDFAPHENLQPEAPKPLGKWRCLNCSYIHQGDAPPEICPVCAAPADRFEAITDKPQSTGAEEFTGRLVVIGAGVAGVSAVEAFRDAAPNATATLVSREPELPYYRLNLTRYLAGEIAESELPIHDADWFEANNIELKLGADVADIQLDAQSVLLGDDSAIPYDKLIITMGAHPFMPPFPGSTLEGVLSVRTVRDAKWILNFLRPGMRCVVVGGGVLGLETAGALAARDAKVTLLESFGWLMPRQLNQRAGEILQAHVKGLGVDVRNGARTKELIGDERVAGVLLEDGETIDADLVIVATGVRPNSHLARRAGLVVNKGVVVDNHLVSSHPLVYAAGDVAEHQGVLYGSWAASQFQGSIAGMNAAGSAAQFGGIPRSNTLKALGLDMLSIGRFEPEDGSYQVIETEADSGYYRFVFRDEHLAGSVLVGDTSLSGAVKNAIENRTDFSSDLLAGISAGAFISRLRR
ncbi:MAG: FAD-dependent oxidoreductase [Phycisphaerales bacterium]|jgi:nitrite reductase (NADH) large subunit|nr:FAD-dependent oxidoreductase [Phycisphaerales bacterium]